MRGKKRGTKYVKHYAKFCTKRQESLISIFGYKFSLESTFLHLVGILTSSSVNCVLNLSIIRRINRSEVYITAYTHHNMIYKIGEQITDFNNKCT